MNSRETSRAKVDKTFLKNSLALKLIEIRYEHVCCIEFRKKGGFSACFQKNRKEKHSAPISKLHTPSVNAQFCWLNTHTTRTNVTQIIISRNHCLPRGLSVPLWLLSGADSYLLHPIYCLLQLQQKVDIEE